MLATSSHLQRKEILISWMTNFELEWISSWALFAIMRYVWNEMENADLGITNTCLKSFQSSPQNLSRNTAFWFTHQNKAGHPHWQWKIKFKTLEWLAGSATSPPRIINISHVLPEWIRFTRAVENSNSHNRESFFHQPTPSNTK